MIEASRENTMNRITQGRHSVQRASRSTIARRRLRIAALVESMPEATAASCGSEHLSLEVRGKQFGYYLDDHHGDGRVALNCKAEPGANEALVALGPNAFTFPPILGREGGGPLDRSLTDEVRSIIVDAYRLTAPKRLVAQLDARSGDAEA